MRVLVACEESGAVRDAFIRGGHEAWSCDLLPSRSDFGPHIQGDVSPVLDWSWDLIIAFPPCDDLAVSGARWFPEKRADGRQQRSIEFFMMFASANCPRICIENPVGIMSTLYRKPDQIIQPWQFGHGDTKATCLWLKGLPPLRATNPAEGREQRVWKMTPGPNRKRDGAATFKGIADAMASQWGDAP